jgi:hypothetical protein
MPCAWSQTALIERLRDGVAKAVAVTELHNRFLEHGIELVGSPSSEEFAAFLRRLALGVPAGSGLGADKTYGYLIIAIKPDLLVPLEDFRRDMSEMARAREGDAPPARREDRGRTARGAA